MPAQLLALALFLLPSPPEPLDAREIAALAEAGDVWRVPDLESIFDGRWARLARFPPSLPPPEIERELVASLEALARLDPASAVPKARIVLAGERTGEARRAARRALGAAGELEAIRRELLDFFSTPREAKDALAAAAAAGDVRLRDFVDRRETAFPDPRSLMERHLAAAVESRSVRALLSAGSPARVLGALAPGVLDDRIERALSRSLASSLEREALEALEALASRRALGVSAIERLLDDDRSAVRALTARLCNDAEALRARLEEDATEPFFTEAVRSLVRLEGAEGARALAPRVRGRGFRASLAVIDGIDDIGLARDLVLALEGEERDRLLRVLAEEDRAVLIDVPLTAADVDRLYPYLARSRYPALRDRLVLAERERGRALASGLLSSSASEDEQRALLTEMEDAWSGALVAGGRPVVERLEALAGSEAIDRFVSDTAADEDFVAALALLDTSRARLRLQAIGTAAAVDAVVSRPDRILSLPALTALASKDSGDASTAARLAVIRLGGAGASAFLRSELASGARDALLGAALSSSIDPRWIEGAIASLAASPESSPDALAALYQLHARHPESLLALASDPGGPLADRVSFVLSLSEEAKRIPLLVDRAVGLGPAASQEAALLGLAERELGPFDRRLHRLAGDVDRRVRFLAAAALVPSGAPWSLRLLAAELDPDDPFERRRAMLAVERLDDGRARDLLEAMVADGTARAFAVGALLDRSAGERRDDRAFQRRAFELLADDVERGDVEALLAASRLSEPAAIAAVVRWLRER